jgi:hypothetical protein
LHRGRIISSLQIEQCPSFFLLFAHKHSSFGCISSFRDRLSFKLPLPLVILFSCEWLMLSCQCERLSLSSSWLWLVLRFWWLISRFWNRLCFELIYLLLLFVIFASFSPLLACLILNIKWICILFIWAKFFYYLFRLHFQLFRLLHLASKLLQI